MDAWAIGKYDLRLTSEEWLDSTPRMIHALRKRQLEQMQQEELRFAIVAANIVNSGFCHPEKAVSPERYMIHKLPPQPQKKANWKSIMAAVRSIPSYEKFVKTEL